MNKILKVKIREKVEGSWAEYEKGDFVDADELKKKYSFSKKIKIKEDSQSL